MPRKKLYGKEIGVRLPQPIMEILERERKAFGLTYAELVRRAVVAYYMGTAPKPSASPPGAGYEGAEGQGGPTRGDEPRPIMKEKEAGGGGG
jgi:hypothetical protein